MKLKKLLAALTFTLGATTINAQTIVSTTATNKNVVLEELTGKTCGYCPDGHRRGKLLYDANPGRVVLLNLHTGGYASGTPNYRTGWGDYVRGLFQPNHNGSFGYPTGSVNRRMMPDASQSDPNQQNVYTSRGYWASNAATILGESSPINVGANASIDLGTRVVTLDVEAYYTAAGTGSSNNFHAIITQNNIPGPQSGAAGNPSAILPNGDYNHQHMVRHNLTPNAGDNIANVAAASLYTNQYTYTAPADINNITVNMSDLQVAVFVTENATTGAIVSGSEANITFTTQTPLGVTNATATLDAPLASVCGTTVDGAMQITNVGSAAINTATFEYTVNGGTPGTYQHTFTTPLATGHYQSITIPAIPGLSPNGASNTVDISVTMLNGTANPNANATTGLTVSTAAIQSASTTTVDFSITTDNYGSEVSWALVDETTGTTVISGGNYPDVNGGATYTAQGTIIDGHCYKMEVKDSYGDGLLGAGQFSLTAGSTTISSGGTGAGANYGSLGGKNFVFGYVTGINDVQASANDVKIMPNPVSSEMTLEFTMLEEADATISIMNALGQQVKNVAASSFTGTNTININTSELASGVYFLNINTLNGSTAKRFVVSK